MMKLFVESLAQALALFSPLLAYLAWDLGVAAAEDVIKFIQRRNQNDYERTKNCKRVQGVQS